MEQDIKLNDGELAVVIGETTIIMNVNTAFELAEKAKSFTSYKEEKEENQEIKDNTEEELNTSRTKPKTHSRVPVIAFRFDSEQADRLYALREGVGKYLGYFDSMQEASNWFDIPKSDIIAVANTWRPYQNYTKAMTHWFGDGKGNIITNVRFSSNYKGKKNRWYAEEGNYGRRYYGLEPNKVVFFREDEIPQFILDKEDSYLIPSCVNCCVKKHLKNSK